jgi:hypothetical protein
MIGWWRPLAFSLSRITPVASSPSIFGHLHVHENEIELLLLQRRRRFGTVARYDRVVPALFEQPYGEALIDGVVFGEPQPR